MCDNEYFYISTRPKQAREKYRKLMGMDENQLITKDMLEDWAIDTVAVKIDSDREKVIEWLLKSEEIELLKTHQQTQNSINKNAAGAAGEYYVLAELLRRNYIASMLYECAENYDILAYHLNNKKHLKIQVKTSQQKSLSWTLGDSAPGYDNDTFYVFVTLVDKEPPQYYIVHSETVHYKSEERHNTPTKSGMQRTNRRKFVLKKEEVSKYKDNWDMML